MKAVLSGTHAGSGGKQHISITGDLSVEGLNVEAILARLTQLEDHVVSLEGVVARLQEQNIRSSTKELAKALEEVKGEMSAVVEPTTPVQEEVKQLTPTNKKKSV